MGTLTRPYFVIFTRLRSVPIFTGIEKAQIQASKEEHDGQQVAYTDMEAQAVEFHVAVRAVDHPIISGLDLGRRRARF